MSVNVRDWIYQDKRYVHATARRAVIAQLTRDETAHASLIHERHLDLPFVRDMVDHVISECNVRVATVDGVGDDEGRPAEIQGFSVEAKNDGTMEFLHLREIYRDMASSALAMGVVGALVNGRKDLILRRHLSPTTMMALLATGAKVVVRPRSV